MLLQGSPVSLECLTSSTTGPPYYSLMTDYLWQLTSPKVHLNASPSFPFPVSLVFRHWHKGLSWKLSSQTWEQEACCKGAIQPLPKVCQALASLCLRLKYWLERLRVGGWWQPLHLAPRCVSAWQSSWVSISFLSCHSCGSSGLVYSVSHQTHERQAAAGTGCIHLCPYPTAFSTASACRAGSVELIFALAARVWLWTVIVSSLERERLSAQARTLHTQ